MGKSIFGGGFIISEKAKQRRIEAERKYEKIIHENTQKWEISERERRIIAGLV